MRDPHAVSKVSLIFTEFAARRMNPKSMFVSHVEAEPKVDQVFLPFGIFNV